MSNDNTLGRLLECQPDYDNEPVEFTHFDQYPDFDKDPIGYRATVAAVLMSWESRLEFTCGFEKMFKGKVRAVMTMGNFVWDVAVMRILERGYDVYASDTMIEVYRRAVP